MHLQYEPDAIVLTVSDNGQGFDFAQAVSSEERHYGLISMRERALEIGAAIEISSGIDHGTDIKTSVPSC
jgi:signal transduction histidine kinase